MVVSTGLPVKSGRKEGSWKTMHWVKGVSAFLRRGSSSNNAGDRVGHQGENSMPPTSWPEVQFR